jgi:hypothetical protein
MATAGERLAKVEALADENRRSLAALHDDVHGGTTVAWAQSIRGRLHHMQSAIEAADKLADATRELVREQNRLRHSRFKTWQWVTATIIGLLTAAAPYVILLLH